MARRIVKRTKVTVQSHKNLESPKIINIPFWLTFYLSYLSNLFEILRWPFSNGHFSTRGISYSLLCSVRHSLNPFVSVSLSPSSVYSPLCFYLPLFDIIENQFVQVASLDKLIWTNVAPHLGFAHNNTKLSCLTFTNISSLYEQGGSLFHKSQYPCSVSKTLAYYMSY